MEDEPNGVRKGQWPVIISLSIIVLGCDLGIYGLWKVMSQLVLGH